MNKFESLTMTHETLAKLRLKASKIKLLLTDNDGVLTDGCVYYSARGEELKKYSLRDGMGVERLRSLVNIDTGIITGENSPPIERRAEKLKISLLFMGIKDKVKVFNEILLSQNLIAENIAYIGDDYNDVGVMALVGFSACPSDSIIPLLESVDYVCTKKGGEGAFREFAELIISLKTKE